ncbi:Vgb family protein [Yersinia sp. 2540 StPb PI]|uniref:Vgb family protein n=1 Tax=Yersinia sp. 2540 StPb PI TaxID=3117406 RepID=UPI003FA430A9
MKKLSVFLFLLSAVFFNEGLMADSSIIYTGFNAPTGIAVNQQGVVYVTNWSAGSITKINTNGKKEVFADNISSPAGITINQNGDVYVSSYSDNYILKISPEGVQQKISTGYRTPTGIAFSKSGNLLITNRSSGDISSLNLDTGSVITLVTGLNLPVGVVELNDGSLVVTQYSGRLTHINKAGDKRELGHDFIRPGVGIVAESDDVIVAIDNGADAVKRVNVISGKTELLDDNFSGAVALAKHGNSYLVGTWNDGNIHLVR